MRRDHFLDAETGVEPEAKPRSFAPPPDPRQMDLLGGLATASVSRTGDPVTSHEAAARRGGKSLRASQEAVYTLMRKIGPVTDDELIAAYRKRTEGQQDGWMWPAQSDSGLRSRRAELVAAGFVIEAGHKVKPDTGNKTTIWAAVVR